MECKMGRYYNGAIEGKLWFAVQSSNDADFFGVKGYSAYLNYHFNKDDMTTIDKGIKTCINTLGSWNEKLDKFFNKSDKIDRIFNEILSWKKNHE